LLSEISFTAPDFLIAQSKSAISFMTDFCNCSANLQFYLQILNKFAIELDIIAYNAISFALDFY